MELDKLIEKFREQQPESVMSYEEPSVNKFDAPLPGQSLTDEPGNYPWEHPPKTPSLEEATDYVYESMMKPENMERMFTLLRMGIPIEALVKIITFSGFLEGKWTVDTAKILEPLVAMLLAKMAKDAQIDNIRIGIGDPKDSEFMEDATLQEMAMKQDEIGIQEPMPEIPAQEGLMARPDIGV